MSDPFSVTGSAVGVASLRLTLCQGFLAYYGPYKAFNDDINEVLSRIQSLNHILLLLRERCSMLSSPEESPLTQPEALVTDQIVNCRKGLEKLQKMLQKCKAACPSDSEHAPRFKNHIDRFMYPFRRDTLMQLMATVNWLQSNIDTSLQVLQL
jgi:hypothetical protein